VVKPWTPKLVLEFLAYGSNKGLEERLVKKLTHAKNGRLVGFNEYTPLLMAKKKLNTIMRVH
jgi:hypothetical protein